MILSCEFLRKKVVIPLLLFPLPFIWNMFLNIYNLAFKNAKCFADILKVLTCLVIFEFFRASVELKSCVQMRFTIAYFHLIKCLFLIQSYHSSHYTIITICCFVQNLFPSKAIRNKDLWHRNHDLEKDYSSSMVYAIRKLKKVGKNKDF